jgi:hypothetical protein
MKYIVYFLVLFTGTILYGEDKVYSFPNGEQITLRIPDPSNKLTKLPGPNHGISGCSCLMCTGNHLLGAHRIPYNYLSKVGYSQWYTLHNNLHNDTSFKGHLAGDALAFGYNLPYPKSAPTPSVFAPTPVDVIYRALREAQLTENDILYDLGCGDGRVLVIAAKVFGCKVVGVDIDKECIWLSQANIKLNKIEKLATVLESDITKISIPKETTVVFVYLQPDLTAKLTYLTDIPLVIAHDKPVEKLKSTKVNVFSPEDNREHSLFFWKKTLNSTTDYL